MPFKHSSHKTHKNIRFTDAKNDEVYLFFGQKKIGINLKIVKERRRTNARDKNEAKESDKRQKNTRSFGTRLEQ